MFDCLPRDASVACLVGRVWHAGHPFVVTVRDGMLVDISAVAPTMSALLELPDPAKAVREATGPTIGPLDEAARGAREAAPLRLLAPCDLQAVKAAGVTFAQSMIERVIEERAKGDPAAAAQIRDELQVSVGASLDSIRPGSEQARQAKEVLVVAGYWSQYLEVGIGPDAEIFTKAQPMSAVGHCSDIGIHPGSDWNNPEPEVVLACSSAGRIVGATLGNDVNLRDFEGRSALLLGKAKDNNGSCAIGPFIRLFDDAFDLDSVRLADIALRVEGIDGFVLDGSSSMARISRDPEDLVQQALNKCHQYPDGMMLFLGTMFAPVADRDAVGSGFTHHVGDTVRISTATLGVLENRVQHSDAIAPWSFGARALMASLSARGVI